MIQVREVTKRYGAKTVVDQLSFTAKPGQITGLLGPNGAGTPHLGDHRRQLIFAYDNGLVQPRA